MSRLGALHLIKPTGPKHTATVIFFHGSGDSGGNMMEWVQIMARNFTFPHIKVMFPTAPLQPYTPNGGAMSNVWFDRADISQHVPEQLDSISKIEVEVKNLIQSENKLGIPSNRIIIDKTEPKETLPIVVSGHTRHRFDSLVTCAAAFRLSSEYKRMIQSSACMSSFNIISACHKAGMLSNMALSSCYDVSNINAGGFSMGGSLSFHTAYRWDRQIAGAFVLSSFLNAGSVVYQELKTASNSSLPPLLQCHGDKDDIVPLEWGQTTFNELTALGAPIQFHILERLGHQINKRGINLVKEFIEKHLPDV